MTRTNVTGRLIQDGSVQREDLNVSSSGQAVITKVIAGEGVTISSTGIDPGTGDVTISAAISGINTHSGSAIVDFGPFSQLDYACSTTIPAPWITLNTVISISIGITTDHDSEDFSVEFMKMFVGGIIPGVSFDIYVNSVEGSWGKYLIYWKEV
jgi:hypothetical protein